MVLQERERERMAALILTEEVGEMQHVGVDVRELVKSQCSSGLGISAEVGTPSASEAANEAELPIALSPLDKIWCHTRRDAGIIQHFIEKGIHGNLAGLDFREVHDRGGTIPEESRFTIPVFAESLHKDRGLHL